jgi:hypothetical protein
MFQPIHMAIFRLLREEVLYNIVQLYYNYITCHGPGSSVGIATGYGLDGPVIESRWGRDFPHLSRPALGHTQPPVHGYQVFFGGRKRPGRDADHSSPSSAEV